MITLGIIVVLLGLLLPAIAKIRAAQRSTTCLSGLRQIGVAFHSYAADNRMRYPDPGVANRSWEQMIQRYFKLSLACPSDEELFPVFGSSYDWRDTGDAATTLAGRSIADVGRQEAVLAFEALPGWHAKQKINVARVDGSAATVNDKDCFSDLRRPLQPGATAVTQLKTAR